MASCIKRATASSEWRREGETSVKQWRPCSSFICSLFQWSVIQSLRCWSSCSFYFTEGVSIGLTNLKDWDIKSGKKYDYSGGWISVANAGGRYYLKEEKFLFKQSSYFQLVLSIPWEAAICWGDQIQKQPDIEISFAGELTVLEETGFWGSSNFCFSPFFNGIAKCKAKSF